MSARFLRRRREQRAVVGRVAHERVDLVGRVEVGTAPAAAHRPGRGLVVLRALAAQGPVAGRGQPRRHLVERSGGDDQDAEDAEEQQDRHHDVRRAEQVEQQGGDDVADRAAALAQRAGVAGDRLRVALGDVHDAEQPQAERAPADELPAGRAVADRVAQVAPADHEQHQRHQPADLADAAGDRDADRAHDRTAELEPDRGGADDRQREHEEADTVAAVLGLEVAGAVADPAGDRADAVGDREPDGGDAPEDGVEEPGDRSPAGADRAGCRAPVAGGRTRRLRRGARPASASASSSLDAVLLCFRVLRARVVEDRSEDPALLREPGGEDVRVATSTP